MDEKEKRQDPQAPRDQEEDRKDEVEEASEQSFPASDPPSFTPTSSKSARAEEK